MGRAESLARLQAVTAYNQQKDQEIQEFAAQAREQVDRAAQMTFSGVGSGADISPTPTTTRRWPSLMERATNRERMDEYLRTEPIYTKPPTYMTEQMRKNANAGASNFVGVQNWVNFNPALKPTAKPQEAPAYVSASGWAHRAEEYGRQADAQKTGDWKAKQAEYDQKIWELEEQARNYSAAGMTDKYLETQAEINRVKAEKASHGESVGQLEAGRAEAEANAERAKATDWEIMIADQIKRTGKEDLLDDLVRISELDDQISLYHSVDENGMHLPASPAERQAQAERDALFTKLHGIYGDVVATWLAYADRVRNRENAEAAQTAIAQTARDNPFWASLATIPANVASGAGFLDVAGQKLNRWATGSDVPVDYNTPAMMISKGVNTARQAVGEEIAKDTQGWVGSDTKLGNLYSGGYQLLMSMADSGVAALTGNPVLLGGAAATSAMEDARQRGSSDGQALAMGLIGGVLEGVMEKFSIDNLLNMTTDGARSAVRNILKQAAIEGSEEFNTTLANTIADQLIMGDKNQMATRARELMALGYSAQRAEEMAKAEFRNSLMADALGGMVSGGVFASVGSAGQMVGNRLANRTTTQQQTQTAPAVQQPQAAPATVSQNATVQQAVDTDRAAVDQAAQMTFGRVGANPENALPLMLPEKSEITRQRGYPYEKEGATYKVVEIPQEKVDEIEAYINSMDNATAKRKFKRILKNLFLGRTYENANTLAKEISYKVGISSRSVGEIISKQPVNAKTLAVLEQLNEIIENARYIASEPTSHEDRARNIERTDLFETETKVGGKPGVAKMRVNVTKEGNKLHFATNKITGDGTHQPRADESRHRGVDGASPVIDSTVPQTGPEVKGNVGDMGAKTSAFPHEVKQSQTATNTIGKNEERWNVPEEARVDASYDAVTEQESLNNARMRLEQDMAGELEHLRNTTVWSNEEVDEGMLILGGYRQQAEKTGDWNKFQEWSKVVKQHGVSAGQGLQAWAKHTRMTADGIMQTVAELLDKADPKTDVSEALQITSEMANRFEAANIDKDVDGLVQIIRDTSHVRRTGSFFGNKLSKQMNWALDHIANMAKQQAAESKVAPAGSVQKPKVFKVGDTVQALDRGNFGKVVTDNEDGTYVVHFVSRSGQEATVTFEGKDLKDPNARDQTFGTISSTPGAAYEFLRNFAAAGIEDIAGDHTKVSAGKVIKTIRYNAMLSKAATVLRNLVGNGVMDVTDTFARDISVPLDMLLSTITKTRSVAVDKSWISDAKRKGSVDAFAMALMETGLDVNASGASNRYEQTANRTAKMSGGVMERLLSSWEKWTAYNLTVTDEVAKGGTAAEVQRGIDKLYEQGKIRDDSLRDAGQQEALYRTFQDDTKLSKATGKVRDALNTFGVEDLGAGDIAMPFSKVPSNLPMRAFDYSPAGAAKGMVQLVDVLIKAKKGTLTAAEQAKAVQSIGRGLTGSMVIWGLTALAKAGLIHVMSPGGTEENKDKELQEKNQGLSGTQFNLSGAMRWMQGGSAEWQEGDQLLSIGFLEPFNAHMAIAALIAEDEDATLGQILGATFSGLLQSISELPVMDVIADAVNAFRYSDGDNLWEKTVDAGTTYLAGQATSFIPNALKGIAQGLDPMQRDLYTADTVGGQLLDQVKASIPGLRNTLPVKLDSYGRPMENEGGVKNFLNATVNPGAVTTYHDDEVEAATRMLAEDTGRASVYAERKPPNHLTVDGEQIQLDVDQRRGYQQTRGQTEHETKAALNADDTFTGLDRALQADAFETAETYSKEIAKSGLGLGYEPLKWVKDLEGKSQEEVIDAIIQKTLENADGYGDADLAAALSMTVEDGLSSDLARESQDQAQAYADAVYRYELGYTDVPEWVETAMQMTTDQQREKYLAAVAAGNYAEAIYGKKYDGLEQMLSEGQITDEVALLACSNSVQDAYRDACKGKGISAEQFIDVYGHAYSNGESAQERREAGLKYIEGLNVSSTTKAAMAKGLYEAIMEYIPKGSKLPTDWLLDNDADGVVYDQLSDSQKVNYDTYIRGSGLEMADYIDVKNFDSVDGHDKDLVIGYIEANYQSKEQRRALYLAMGYSAKTIPW